MHVCVCVCVKGRGGMRRSNTDYSRVSELVTCVTEL